MYKNICLGLVLLIIGVCLTGCATTRLPVVLDYTRGNLIAEDEIQITLECVIGGQAWGFEKGAEIQGARVNIKNNSDEVAVVKWGESSISANGRSCVPFPDGMRYRDAGNPSATPSSVIEPRGHITKQVSFSDDIVFVGSSWFINGVVLKPDETVEVILNLKISKGNKPAKYYTITTGQITAALKE